MRLCYQRRVFPELVDFFRPTMYARCMDHIKKLARIRTLFAKNRPYFSALGNEERQTLMLIMLEGNDLSVGELARRT